MPPEGAAGSRTTAAAAASSSSSSSDAHGVVTNDMSPLHQSETIEILDGAGNWQAAPALLDTGNEHMTCIDATYARLLKLHDEGSRVFNAKEHTTLRGIVPGATAEAPVVFATLRIRGFEFESLRVALTEMGDRRPILIGMDVLSELFSAGLSISKS